MPAETIECPSCRHQVRVPESLFGQPVRCPECKAYFTAPTRDAEGRMGAAEVLAELPPRPVTPVKQRPPISQSPVFLPALFLLLVGVLGVGVNGYMVSQWFVDRVAAENNRLAVVEQFSKIMKQPFDRDQAKANLNAFRTAEFVVFGLSCITSIGALAMLTMRLRWLAVLGSIVAMINVANFCCLIGLPTGIWCLVKLYDPDIRPLFSQFE
jgi:hypothetical protein